MAGAQAKSPIYLNIPDGHDTVVKYLTEKGGIEAGRLEWKGLGETNPLVKPEKTPADKQKNRRVDFIIVDQGGAM